MTSAQNVQSFKSDCFPLCRYSISVFISVYFGYLGFVNDMDEKGYRIHITLTKIASAVTSKEADCSTSTTSFRFHHILRVSIIFAVHTSYPTSWRLDCSIDRDQQQRHSAIFNCINAVIRSFDLKLEVAVTSYSVFSSNMLAPRGKKLFRKTRESIAI